jgi:hypothetical protein
MTPLAFLMAIWDSRFLLLVLCQEKEKCGGLLLSVFTTVSPSSIRTLSEFSDRATMILRAMRRGRKLREVLKTRKMIQRIIERLPGIFTAPEIRQFVAQGRRHRYSNNR